MIPEVTPEDIWAAERITGEVIIACAYCGDLFFEGMSKRCRSQFEPDHGDVEWYCSPGDEA